MRDRKAVVVALIVAVCALVVPTTAPSFAATPPKVVSATDPNSISLTSPGAVVVQSVTIAAGTWSLISKASVIAGSGSDFFRCELLDATHGKVLDGATAFLSSSVPNDVITNVALFTAHHRVTISQECGHDGAGGDGGFVDFNASLVGFATAAADVKLASSSAQTSLTPSVSADVVNLKLPAGSWVVVDKVAPVVLSASSIEVTCSDEAILGGQQRDLGTGSGLHAVSTIFAVGAVTMKKPGTVHLRCGDGATGAYIDPGAVLWAWKASALKRASEVGCPVSGTAATATDALVVSQISQCNIDPGTRASALLSAHLKPGTWIAMGGPFDFASEGANLADCQLFDPNQQSKLDESDATAAAVTGVPVTGLANLAVVVAKRARVVEGDCGEATTGPSAASTGANWVFIRP